LAEKGISKKCFNKLSAKDQEFFIAYLELGCNARKTYMRLNPNATAATAGVKGCLKINKDNMQAALTEHYANEWARREDRIHEVFDKIVRTANADINSVLDVSEDGRVQVKNFTDVDTTSIKKITQSYKDATDSSSEQCTTSLEMYDKQKAQDQLIKILGMITDKVDVNQSGDVTLKLNVNNAGSGER